MAYDLAELFKCGGGGWFEETLDMQQGGEKVMMMKRKEAWKSVFIFLNAYYLHGMAGMPLYWEHVYVCVEKKNKRYVLLLHNRQ